MLAAVDVAIVLVVILLLVLLLGVLIAKANRCQAREGFLTNVQHLCADSWQTSPPTSPMSPFSPLSRSFPTKCFSCERQFPVGYRWAAQPTKCFSCERHAAAAAVAAAAAARTGHAPSATTAAQLSHPNKCYDCEKT